MRKTLAFFYLLVIAGFACIAHAQLTQTGAGKFGSGGGGFTPCAGTPIHLADPNNLSTVNWNAPNLTRTFGVLDPVGGSTATDLVTNNATMGAFSVYVANATPFTLSAGTVYQFGAYFKSIVVPPFVGFQIIDGSAFVDQFTAYFNIATFQVPNTSVGGQGVLDCAQIGAAGNGYAQVSMSGHLTTTPNANMVLRLFPMDTAFTGNETLNQEFYAWQVSP